MEDPFFVVKQLEQFIRHKLLLMIFSFTHILIAHIVITFLFLIQPKYSREVQKTIEMAITLFYRWCELSNDMSTCTKEEYDWTTNELKNCLRSIEWDLEDLDETIVIVEKNMKKFKITAGELKDRKIFIETTRSSVKEIRDHMTNPQLKSKIALPFLHEAKLFDMPNGSQNKYSRLEDEADSVDESFVGGPNIRCLQLEIEQPEMNRSDNLRDTSPQHTFDHDEQTVMLDDTVTILDGTESKLSSLAKKFSRVLKFSKANWKPWTAVSFLLLVVLLIVILFFVL